MVLLSAVLSALVLAASPASSAGPLRFQVEVAGYTDVRVTITGPEADLAPGPFRGVVSVNGSAAELPMTGTVTHADGKFKLAASVRYAELPEAWTEGFRTDTFTYRLKGASGDGPAREWTGTQAFHDVEVAGEGADKFVALQDVHITDMSLLSSDAVGKLMLVNPLAFDVKIAELRYTLLAENEPVGEGSARGLILRGGRKNILSLPIAIDHASLLSAAGKAVAAGGDVAVRLQGQLVLRLKGGDVTVPLNLSGHLTGAS
jgi:LEA14-like dessication related protein